MTEKLPFETEFSIGGDSHSASRSVVSKLIQHYLLPIEQFFSDGKTTSIGINRYDDIWIRRGGAWEKTDAVFSDEDTLTDAINQVINNLGQQIDPDRAPLADARLPDGSRVNAVLYPTAHRGSNMTIRLFPKVRYTLDDLLEKGMMSEEIVDFLRLSVECEQTTAVGGATGSGKTTILNALADLTPLHTGRMGVIEDTAELNITRGNVVFMEAPKRSIQLKDGEQPVTMEGLLVNVLRQELGSIVVGEIRTPAAATAMMLALNTGHRAVKTTAHANNTKKLMRRFINMLLSNDTRIPYEAVRDEIFDNFDLLIQAEHTPRHGRRIVEIDEVDDGELRPLYRWDYLEGTHKRVFQGKPKLFSVADRYGIELPARLKEYA